MDQQCALPKATEASNITRSADKKLTTVVRPVPNFVGYRKSPPLRNLGVVD
jgi:hypothetical protein